jgi:uncharacterized membrane protein HdeD (DUF308 family)
LIRNDPYRGGVRRPQTSDAWIAMVSGVVVLIASVVLIVAALSHSRWWPIAIGVLAVCCLVSAVAQFRMQTRKTSGRP